MGRQDTPASRAPDQPIAGVLCVNKPQGLTSHDVVARVRRVLGRRVKVGHAGTLDPAASGVLVVCVGAATRLIRFVQDELKTYRAAVRLGARSDTDDQEGRVRLVEGVTIPTRASIEEALAEQIGRFMQQPPRYSALKVRGERAYALARAGLEPNLSPREVNVVRMEILNYAWPLLELDIECGSGTYIRSIARDLGARLGCGGLLQRLVRTRVGPFALDQSIALTGLDQESINRALREPLVAVASLPRVVLDSEQAREFSHGRAIDAVRHSAHPVHGQGVDVAVLEPTGGLIGVARYEPKQGLLCPKCVLPRTPISGDERFTRS